MTGDDAVTAPAPPLLRVVRGDPTPEELAAVVAVVAARAAGAAAEAAAHAGRRRSSWADPARLVREPVRARPGGWRASALPR